MKHAMQVCLGLFAVVAVLALFAGPAGAADKKPNVVMLMQDDTGWNDFAATTAAQRSAIRPRTSTAWPMKAPDSRAGTARPVARRAAPHS